MPYWRAQCDQIWWISPHWLNFYSVWANFWGCMKYFWQIFNVIGKLTIVESFRIMKNNLAIWSHWHSGTLQCLMSANLFLIWSHCLSIPFSPYWRQWVASVPDRFRRCRPWRWRCTRRGSRTHTASHSSGRGFCWPGKILNEHFITKSSLLRTFQKPNRYTPTKML